jgi:nitroimidazol reductase NimA-like FMN-containing flavoprotein (pyridoxamine 5'-phosphate oxidase superfamily)
MLGELNEKQIVEVLSTNMIGRIGCYADDKIYVVPVAYIYDDGCLLGHTIRGMKTSMLKKNPKCCFEVDSMQNMSNWQSVIAWGKFEELEGDEARTALKKLVSKLMPMMSGQNNQHVEEIETLHKLEALHVKATVYRINIEEKTGRFEKNEKTSAAL